MDLRVGAKMDEGCSLNRENSMRKRRHLICNYTSVLLFSLFMANKHTDMQRFSTISSKSRINSHLSIVRQNPFLLNCLCF